MRRRLKESEPEPSPVRVRKSKSKAIPKLAGAIVPVGGTLNVSGRSTMKSTITPVNKRAKQLFAQYKPEYPALAAQLILNGATEQDLIVAFKTKRPTFRLWQLTYPEFAASCVIAREASMADRRVESSLYEMANGYTLPATKIMSVQGKVVKVPYVKHVAKDFNAAKFWLANRDKERWGKDPDALSSPPADQGGPVNIKNFNVFTMLRGMSTESLKEFQKSVVAASPSQRPLTRLDAVDVDAEIATIEEGRDAKKKD